MADPDLTTSPASVAYERLHTYINEFMGGEDWPEDLRWKLYQIKHSLVHSFHEHGYPIGMVPDYDHLTSIHLFCGVAFGLALAQKALDMVLYDLPVPGKNCDWPWTFDQWQKAAAEEEKKEG